MDTSKDVSAGKDTQPRASAGSAAAHMPQRPQRAAPGAGDAWGSRSVHHRMKQKATAVHLGGGAEHSRPQNLHWGVRAASFGSTELGSPQNVLGG